MDGKVEVTESSATGGKFSSDRESPGWAPKQTSRMGIEAPVEGHDSFE